MTAEDSGSGAAVTGLLEKFRELNPHLLEGQGQRRCQGLWELLTSRHRESSSCCHHDGSGLDLESSFLYCSEQWKDGGTGLPVIVAHPLSGHADEDGGHGAFREFLAFRGLHNLVSDGSWHNEGARLVVVARADVIAGVRLPSEDGSVVEVSPGELGELDWEMREVLRLAEEGLIRDRNARFAEGEEAEGRHSAALRLYCEVAHSDRTGGFHRMAREQLERARRLLAAHPGLDRSSLCFRNGKDREYVCGPAPALLSEADLQRRLDRLDLPSGWGKFMPYGSGLAFCRFTVGRRTVNVTLAQGGDGSLWSSSLDVDSHGVYRTSVDDEPEDASESANYCWPDPESAVTAAIEIWKQLGGDDEGA